MGFNVIVCGGANSTCEDSKVFINRSYYNFVASYEMFMEDSVLICVGNYLGLDLHPLVKLAYLDSIEEEDDTEVDQNVEELLELVRTLYDKVKSNPAIIDEISYKAKKSQYIMWKEYFKSGQIPEDLEALIQSLAYYKNAGATTVFFGVG